MTPEDLAAIDDYIDRRVRLENQLVKLHYRTERTVADAVLEAAKAWQRISQLAGRVVGNDEAWAKFSPPGEKRPKEF